MREMPVLISVNMDKEEVGLTFENYNLVSAGVVNKDNKLIGMITADDAEIIRTSTGSISFPSLVSFSGQQRLVGEEAVPQSLNPNTISYLDQLLGDDIATKELAKHLKLSL